MLDERIPAFLKSYDGEELKLMEICGSHTAAVEENGIRSMLSPRIRLVSGPGCPVCVTVSAYIDRLIELAEKEGSAIVSFGDLLRVPGSFRSLSEAKAEGADVRLAYSPMEMLDMAAKEPDRSFVFAAVGFETTAPVYARLIEEAVKEGIDNIRLLCALKTMPAVVERLCGMGGKLSGFIAPGHVCAVGGFKIFEDIAERFSLPFVVAGFDGEQLLSALFFLVRLKGKGLVRNLYGGVVTQEGNKIAQETVDRIFEKGDASWRGLGKVEGSGLYLRKTFSRFDAGSYGLDRDSEAPLCHCAEVITGRESAGDCPLFGKNCTPVSPKGACMVSREGACFNMYRTGEKP